MSFSVLVSSGYMPMSGIAGIKPPYRNSILSSIEAVSIYIPTNSARAVPFLQPSPAFIVCRLFDDGNSGPF